MTATTITHVLDFIAGHADERQIDTILETVKGRRKTLDRHRALAVRKDQKVTLNRLTPKYLNGLTGTVTALNDQRCTVTLDEDSTNTLRYTGRRYTVPPTMKNYPLQGVPTSCCEPQD